MVGRELRVGRSGQEERVEEDQAGLMKVAICQFYINAPPTTPARPPLFGNPGQFDRPVIVVHKRESGPQPMTLRFRYKLFEY